MADWATISSLATAGGTLVLGIATFASVRSANRAARTAERALQVGLRPVLMQSRLEDPTLKIMFVDDHWARVPGAGATAEAEGGVIYLTMSLRNVGAGIGVLHGWHPISGWPPTTDPLPAENFRRLSRDLYVPAGDIGLWQGALREDDDSVRAEFLPVIAERARFSIDLLYGDHEGGQRTITRFTVTPRGDEGWLCSAVRHWNLDRDDPR